MTLKRIILICIFVCGSILLAIGLFIDLGSEYDETNLISVNRVDIPKP